MINQSLLGFLPIIATILTALIVMIAASFRVHQGVIASLCCLGLLSSLITSFVEYNPQSYVIEMPLLVIDSYGLFMMQFILIVGMIIILFSYEYWRKQHIVAHEYYLSIILSIVGALVMVTSDHLASFFLGLELMTIPLYALISYFSYQEKSLEAGVKYIILASASTSLLLFGIALMYFHFETMSLLQMHARIEEGLNYEPAFVVGFALIIVGIAFKISAVPFHLWTPDVFNGAPLPVTAYLATLSKGATMAIFLRLWQILYPLIPEASWVIALMSGLSMIGGNLLALKQDNVKRLLGFSSIAHFGYILMTLLSTGASSLEAFMFYLFAYSATILLIFGTMMCLPSAERQINTIDDLKGFIREEKTLGFFLALGFFSLMGLPFTAIFMGKILVIMAGFESSQWFLLASLIISSILGFLVYMRLINALFSSSVKQHVLVKGTAWTTSVLAVLALITFLLGIWPTLATNLMPSAYEQLLQAENSF